MTKTEALDKLNNTTPTSDPWYKNKGLTWQQAHKIVLDFVIVQKSEQLPEWVEKRVNEVIKNKKIKVCPHCGGVL